MRNFSKLILDNTPQPNSVLLASVITYIDEKCHYSNTEKAYHGTFINMIHWLLKDCSL
jgi:hypothetical protein